MKEKYKGIWNIRSNRNYKASWYKPLTPELGRQRQDELYELEANLVYSSNSRPARAKQWDYENKIKETLKLGVISHTPNSSTWEIKIRKSAGRGGARL